MLAAFVFCLMKFLQRKALEPFAKFGAEVVALESELDGGFEEAEFVTCVVALAFVGEAVDLFVLEQGLDGVGELQFAACAGLNGFEHFEDAWGEDVASDDGVLAGLRAGCGLLHHVAHGEQLGIFFVLFAVEAAVGGDGVAFDDF